MLPHAIAHLFAQVQQGPEPTATLCGPDVFAGLLLLTRPRGVPGRRPRGPHRGLPSPRPRLCAGACSHPGGSRHCCHLPHGNTPRHLKPGSIIHLCPGPITCYNNNPLNLIIRQSNSIPILMISYFRLLAWHPPLQCLSQ